MNLTSAVGLTLLVVGGFGYAVGITTRYPGRSFSVTAIMIGITMVAIGRASGRGSAE